jgi:UDP:flavonoid glycosyltransferase YjiC (YdhE family)
MMGMAMRSRYGARIDAARAGVGLPKTKAAPIIEPGMAAVLSIGLYSPELAPLAADAPDPAMLTGFAWFDSADGRPPVLDEGLAAFLADGPPPLVVSLGSFVPFAADAFYRDAATVARQLGLRAVLLTGEAKGAMGTDIFICPYAPHSLLFPHAAAIVHHGGVGTTGQALRSGRPQLVTPFMSDQFDHAERIARKGNGLWVLPKRFAAEGSMLIQRLVEEPAFAVTACGIAERIGQEDGAGAAADALLALAAR